MKKVVILSPAHPLRGGIASSSERFAQEIQEGDTEVEIFSFSLQYPNFLFPGKTQFSNDKAPENLSIRTIINSINPLNWIKVGWMLFKMAPEIVIIRFWIPFMGPCLGTIARMARLNRKTKIVALADNILPHESRFGDRMLTSYFTSIVDAYIVMSRSVETDLKTLGVRDPIRYVPHPIYDNYGIIVGKEQSLEVLELPDNERYILFFGFIRDYKGLDLLLQAMSDPRIKALNLKLIVAGEYYSDEALYRSMIKKLGIGNDVIIRDDYVPHDDVKYYFGAADIVVQPYKTATQSGISQLAYHFEKPMIVTNVGGLPEMVEDGKAGYVVEVNSKAIADALVDFYENNKQELMTNGVRENKEEFAWDKMVEALEDLYVIVK